MFYATALPRNLLAPHWAAAALAQRQQACQPAGTASNVTVSQDDKTTTLQIDVPGLAREQLHITIEDAQVSVRSSEGAPRQVHRVWELPEPINAADSSAKLENGVLTLTLARLAPASRAVELTVH